MKIELNYYQIKQLLEMSEVSGDPEYDPLVIQMGDERSHSGPGLYAWFSESPEEGSIYIAEDDADKKRAELIADQPGQQAQSTNNTRPSTAASGGSGSDAHSPLNPASPNNPMHPLNPIAQAAYTSDSAPAKCNESSSSWGSSSSSCSSDNSSSSSFD